MKYYSIHPSSNRKIIGHYPQQKDSVINGNVNSPIFIGNLFLKTIDFDPVVPHTVLHDKSNLTDLLATTGQGYSFTLTLSDMLKNIIEQNANTEDFQFFKSDIIQNKNILASYWLLHPIKERLEIIDYNNSEIFIADFVNLEQLDLKNHLEFETELEKLKREGYKGQSGSFFLEFERMQIKDYIDRDIFYARYRRGCAFYVSKRLKEIIEAEGCTGIEFIPTDMSYNEWMNPGGYKESVYGYV